MILRAENILGGVMLTSAFCENPTKTDGVAILTTWEAMFFCTSIDRKLNFEKKDELAMIWKDNGATILIQASHCECSSVSMRKLAAYIRSQANDAWQLGCDPE